MTKMVQDPLPRPGGYAVMIDGEQFRDHQPTLAAQRLVGQALCDGQVLPAKFSIHDGDGEHSDIGITVKAIIDLMHKSWFLINFLH